MFAFIVSKLRFHRSLSPIFVGCGFYKLDGHPLKTERPIFYETIEPFINDRSWIGYIIPPSTQFYANPIMEVSILEHAMAAFEDTLEKE